MNSIDKLYIGKKVSVEEEITENLIQKFAECSGDYSPIHLDEAYAVHTKFGRCIAHGMISGAFISKLLGMYLPGEGTIYLSQNLDFLLPVYVGDVLEIIGEIIELIPSKNICVIKTTCQNQNGEIVVTGQAKVMPPKEMR